ncbi:MAG: hydrogenase small subunit [Thermodesulfobacteriota bacterium]
MSDEITFHEQPGDLNRRSFLKGCATVAAALGLSESMVPQLVEAATKPGRPPVLWLHFQECTGCTESLLRASHPDIGRLILDIISLDYHETVMAADGHQAEANLHATADKYAGKFICVVEGAIPTKDKGVYCQIAGKTAMEILAEVAPKAAAVIAIGTCASFGGVQAAAPNPTGAVGVAELLSGGPPLVNISGCPPNPICFLGTVLHFLTFNRLPALDHLNRPKFAYGRRIHDQCERRPHFDEGRFVEQFGDAAHKEGFCLYKVGCKGPATFSNCPVVRFNDVGSWPVGVGHGCIGCTEPDFWDTMSPFYERLPQIKIPGGDGIIANIDATGKKVLAATAVGIGVHAAVGIGKSLKEKDGKDE